MQSHGVFYLVEVYHFHRLEVLLHHHQMARATCGVDATIRAVDDDIAEVKVFVSEEHLRLEVVALSFAQDNLTVVAHRHESVVFARHIFQIRHRARMLRPRYHTLARTHEALEHGGVVDVASVA